MQNQRNPIVSRIAAIEAAERLQQLTAHLDDGVLKRILSEANRTIDRQERTLQAFGVPTEQAEIKEQFKNSFKVRLRYN